MIKFGVAYGAMVLAIIIGDLIWLGVVARPLYQQGIGHLMAEQPNFVAASLFYLIYPLGVMYLVLGASAGSDSWTGALISGAIFGFVAYATYDLSNLATLKDWPVYIAFVDIAWGTALTTVSTAAGKAVLDQMGAG